MAFSKVSIEAARRLRAQNGLFHLPPTAQPLRGQVTLMLEGTSADPQVVLTDTRRGFSWRVFMERVDNSQTWMAQVMMPTLPTIVRYHFELADGKKLYEHRQIEGRNLPVYDEWSDMEFQIAVYHPDRMPADWTKGMVIYQIFPDRFANGDTSTDREALGVYGHEAKFMQWNDLPEQPPLGRDFYGGDIRGVIDKLDYLAELGVDCIYFTPVFWSPTNHRYDANDYFEIDPMLGTEAEMVELFDKAHERDIKIVLDGVFNHCSCDSIYFDISGKFDPPGATQSKHSPYYRWFEFHTWPDGYSGWIGLKHMPEFVECPEVEEFFLGPEGVTAYWLEKGADGWRTDVTGCNSDEFWRRFRNRVETTKPGAYLVSEHWEDSTHYMLGDTFNATMNYRFAWALRGYLATDNLSPTELDDRLMTWQRDTPPPAVQSQMNLLDSHDTGRLLTACSGDRQRMKQVIAFQFAYPGAPMIYYGDETALEGKNAEDGRRTMPWEEGLDQDMLNYYKQVIGYRRTCGALRTGDVETVVIDDANKVYVFARRESGEVVYAAFNGSDSAVDIAIPLKEGESGQWRDALETHAASASQNGQLNVRLEARGAAWYVRG